MTLPSGTPNSPRSSDRGPIEAPAGCSPPSRRAPFPRSSDRGPIEASKRLIDLGSTEDYAYGVLQQIDGRIVIAGYIAGPGASAKLVRIPADGVVFDGGFGVGGIVSTDLGGSSDYVHGLAATWDGKLLISGTTLAATNDLAVARYHAGMAQRVCYQNDAQFNVTSLSNEAGQIVERYQQTPYGQRTTLNADWTLDADGVSDYANALGHQGLLHDFETGLVYNRARHLHVTLGVFAAPDPLGHVDGMNLYQAYRGNPIQNVDPLGLHTATTQPTTQQHHGATCPTCGVNDISDDRGAADDTSWVGEMLFGATAANCEEWANPGYPGIVVDIFGAGTELGYTEGEGWRMSFPKHSGGPWTQAGAQRITAALVRYLSRPNPGDTDPRGFVLDDCSTECPCGYFKSSFFVRPNRSGGGDYHFHHFSCRKGAWTEKEGSRNPARQVGKHPLQDSGGGYLVACYCSKGNERHTPDEL